MLLFCLILHLLIKAGRGKLREFFHRSNAFNCANRRYTSHNSDKLQTWLTTVFDSTENHVNYLFHVLRSGLKR